MTDAGAGWEAGFPRSLDTEAAKGLRPECLSGRLSRHVGVQRGGGLGAAGGTNEVTKVPLPQRGPVPWTEGCWSEAAFKLCAQIGVTSVRPCPSRCSRFRLPLPFPTRRGAHGQGQGQQQRDPVAPQHFLPRSQLLLVLELFPAPASRGWRSPGAGGPGAGHTPPGKAAGLRKVSSSLSGFHFFARGLDKIPSFSEVFSQ